MKVTRAILIVLAAAAQLALAGQQRRDDRLEFLRQEAEIYVEAYMRKDYDTCMTMMGAGLVNAMGGKLSILDHFRSTEEQLKKHHMTLETISVDAPNSLVAFGASELYAVIPERHILTGKNGEKYVLDSYVLAISEDKGASWSMLEGSWRISEHIKNRNLELFDRLKLPVRRVYPADDPRLYMVEKGGGFITPPETIAYKQKLHQSGNTPPRAAR